MRKVADAVTGLCGWRRAGVAATAGAVSALAMAPWFAFPVLWFTLPVLVWLIDGAVARGKARRFGGLAPAAVAGWGFGFGYFVAGLWWIGAAFFVEADKFVWLAPVAVVGLPALLAVFWALGAVLAQFFWPQGWARILVFAAALSLAEWLRGHVLTGFPWNAFGYALAPTPAMMQSAALVGLWGLTLAAFIVFAAPALLASPAGKSRGDRIFVGCAAALFVAHAAFGVVRLAAAPAVTFGDVRLRIVQPAVPQNEKWLEENADAIYGLQLDLSATGGGPGRDPIEAFDVVIWPESAFPFYLEERPEALWELADLLPAGTTLIAGAARLGLADRGEPPPVFNSILVIDGEGEITDTYDKAHLVPFGEYLPYQAALESIGLRQLTGVIGGFAAGPGRRTIAPVGVPGFGALICYEIIFPGAATEPGRRPAWLLNVTNDAWYGDTPGPRQHFQQARLRAVEEGLPLVRAANTGISAIVDPYGEVIASLGVDKLGVVDGLLPMAGSQTVYGRYGDLAFWTALLCVLCTATISRFSRFAFGNSQKCGNSQK